MHSIYIFAMKPGKGVGPVFRCFASFTLLVPLTQDFLMYLKPVVVCVPRVTLFVFTLLWCVGCQTAPPLSWETDKLYLQLDMAGQLAEFGDKQTQADHLAADQPAALLSLHTQGQIHAPNTASRDAEGQVVLGYEDLDVQAVIEVVEHPTHLALTLVEVRGDKPIDAAVWGPYPMTVGDTIGKIVGVVRDDQAAIGLLGLNPSVISGTFERAQGGEAHWRGRMATQTEFGSTLQAHSIDRSRMREIPIWNERLQNVPVAPIEDMTIVGSSVAMFLCHPDEVLERIEQVILAEGLPYLVDNDGQWIRGGREGGEIYMIADFTEANVDRMIEYALAGGFTGLYHGGPFSSWGHFEFRKDHFPNGAAGFRACSDKIHAAGLHCGAHVLTNFIHPHDPFVSPIPDSRLAVQGTSDLVEAVDAAATQLVVSDPAPYRDGGTLRTVRIGEELIQYAGITEQAPYYLTGCMRGAFGTRASAHGTGDTVDKLVDHPYRVFFPDMQMQEDMVQKLVAQLEAAGIDHIDYDGHEGCVATGQGVYAMNLFAQQVNDAMPWTLYNGSSCITHWYWYLNTTINWGEPWYGGFRESQLEYRFNNLPLLENNYIPKMLGWFAFREDTTLADAEWLMARGAGHDAGFALATGEAALRSNPNTQVILEAIGNWESLRQAGVFTEAQRELFRDLSMEFHLTRDGDRWVLEPTRTVGPLTHQFIERQPGEPTDVQWQLTCEQPQPMAFSLQVDGAALEHPVFTVAGRQIVIPVTVLPGQRLVGDVAGVLTQHDAEGRAIWTGEIEGGAIQLIEGTQAIRLDGTFAQSVGVELRVHLAHPSILVDGR